MDIQHLLTIADFCQTVGISRSTWQNLKRDGKAPPIIEIGKTHRIRWETVQAWLAENEKPQPTERKTGISDRKGQVTT